MNEFSAIVWTAIVGAFATIVVGVMTYFGGKNSASALMQDSINKGFKTLSDERKAEIEELRGEIRGLRQYVQSLEEACRKAGITLPERKLTVTVFAPFPEVEHPNA